MIVHLNKCRSFVSGDRVGLREILHPAKRKLKIRYSLAHATLKSGKSSIPHKLKVSEVYYILEGRGKMRVDNITTIVRRSDTVYIAPNSIQFIENTGKSKLKFLCIVDPAWRQRDEIICYATPPAGKRDSPHSRTAPR